MQRFHGRLQPFGTTRQIAGYSSFVQSAAEHLVSQVTQFGVRRH